MKSFAEWNSSRDYWETGITDIFGHSDAFLETWPTSGMTRNGVAYALPTWEHRTAGSASSCSPDVVTLLLTPVASEGTKPSNTMGVARRKATGEVFLTNQIVSLCGLDPSEAQVMDLLPTTTAMDYKASGGAAGSPNVTLTDALVRGRGLLPTPCANIGTNGGSQHPDKRRSGNHQPSIQDVAEFVLLQTPSVADGTGGHLTRSGARSNEKLLPGQAKELATDWGQYGPAIRRWEKVLGRPAPSPTEPNSKGNPRLSPKFTEWLMGVPAGWITGIPISRNEQLKACGNGVVPQQAAAALKDMLGAFGATP